MFKSIYCGLLSLLLCNFIYAAVSDPSVMGKINFPSTINKEAQPFFINGVLFLHNFDYDKARQQFQHAEQLDPYEVLPYWGEAMTYNHPLWGEVDIQAGQRVLKKIGNNASLQLLKAHDEKEKGYIKAIQALYGSGDKVARDKNYLQIMFELYHRYPNDLEIASFYALALLGSTEGQRDFTVYMRSAAVAEDIVRKNPEHPGAIHYAIHAFDDPIHAPLGLYYADKYSKIASDAPHALHMPSHIYLALGMWSQVIESNKKAWAAGLESNPKADAAKFTIHDFHALQWLSYGYLQQRDYKAAFQCVKMMEQFVEKHPSPMAKWYYALMRAAYIVESGDFQANLKTVDMKGIELNGAANNAYVDSLIRLNSMKDKSDLTSVILYLEQLSKSIPKNVAPSHHDETDYFTSVSSGGITVAKIVILELKAQIALKSKDFTKAITFLQEAVKLEEQMPFGYGPPSPVKPAQELLADVYFENKNYLLASQYYQKALSIAPNRTLSQIAYKKTLAILQKHDSKAADVKSAH